MSTIVIMPGGFHPFHAGHAALYDSARKAFPNAEVFVAATNDTSTRPFPFAIKEKLAKLAGVQPGHFVQVKSPFRAEEITSQFDPARDRLIFVRSEKDADKQPQAGGVKKDGSPSYLQPLAGQTNIAPFSKHAYMAYLPTVEFGPGMTSATEIRTAWPTLNEKRKTALVMSLYPQTQQNPPLAATVVKMLDAAIGSDLAESNMLGSVMFKNKPNKLKKIQPAVSRTKDFMKKDFSISEDSVTEGFNSKQEVIDHFVKQGKSAGAGAAAWERGWRGPKAKTPKTAAPKSPQQKYWWQDKEDLNEFAPDGFNGGDDETPGSWDDFIRAFDPEIKKMGFGMDKRSSHDARIYAHPEAQKGIMVRQHPERDNVYFKLFHFFNQGEDEVGLADLSQNGAASVLVKVEDFLNGQQGLNEFAPDEGGGSRKFIPWPEFIDAVKQIVGKDFAVTEKVIKSTIQDRFIPHDPMEYGPTMLYSYYEARAGRNKGAMSTRGSIQVGKYYPNNTALGTRNFITQFSLLKGHPFERHFDLTFDNIYKIANIILGNTEGAFQMQPQQGVAEMDAQNMVGGMTASYQDRENQPVDEDYVEEKWSQKYKSSINCSNPKGFSQKAHCAGRKK